MDFGLFGISTLFFLGLGLFLWIGVPYLVVKYAVKSAVKELYVERHYKTYPFHLGNDEEVETLQKKSEDDLH